MALYLNVSQPMGGALNWSEGERLDEMDSIFAEMIRQINFIVSNLGADNVIEAASVKAENIDTKNAKIVNAQIKNLTADKIQAGTLDLSKGIVISDSKDLAKGNSMTITQNGIVIKGKSNDGKVINRFVLMPDGDGNYLFAMYDKDGDMSLAMDDDGNAAFRGTVASSEIYSSHIVGTDQKTYGEYTPSEDDNGVFVDIDNKGIKVMQDMTDGNRLQKIGMTSDTNGNPMLVIGSGADDEQPPINGVRVPTGSMVISKTYDGSVHTGNIFLSGDNCVLLLNVPGGTLDIYASDLRFNVYHNIINTSADKQKCVATEQYVDNEVRNLEKKIDALENRLNSMGA